MELSNFSQLADSTYYRGLEYWRDGRVKIEIDTPQHVMATVRGTMRYQVVIDLEGDKITKYRCNCPCGSGGGCCKHVLATLCEIRKRRDKSQTSLLEIMHVDEKPQVTKSEIAAEIWEDSQLTGVNRRWTQLEWFYLCYLAYMGYRAQMISQQIPTYIISNGRLTLAAQKALLQTLRDEKLLINRDTVALYGEIKEILNTRYVMELLRNMVTKHPDWPSYFQGNGYGHAIDNNYLYELAEMLEGKRTKIKETSSYSFVGDENNYIVGVLIHLIDTESAQVLCRVLSDRTLFLCLYDILHIVGYYGSLERLEKVGSVLDARKQQTDEWHLLYQHYRMLYLYMTGQLLPHLSSTVHTPELYYTQAVQLLYQRKIEEAIEEFQKGLKQVKKEKKWKVIPYDYISFFYYVVALGMRRSENDLTTLRKIMKYANEYDIVSWQPIFALVNFFQDSSQPKNIIRMHHAMDISSRQCTGAIAALILHFWKEQDVYNGVWPTTDLAILRCELSGYGVCDKGSWPYEPILVTIHPKEKWELQLEELIQAADKLLPEAEDRGSQKKVEARLCYVDVGYENEMEVREQTRLKSGTWGKGKKVSYNRYEVADCAMDAADRLIYEAWKTRERSRSRYYQYFPSLELVVPFLKGTDKVYIDKRSNFLQVRIQEEQPFLYTERNKGQIHLASNIPTSAEMFRTMYMDRSKRDEWTYYPFSNETREIMERLLQLNHVPEAAESMLKTLFTTMGKYVEIHSELADESNMPMEKKAGECHLTLRITPFGEFFIAEVCTYPIAGGEKMVFPGEGDAILFDKASGKHVEITRNLKQEKKQLNALNRLWQEQVNEQTFDPYHSQQTVTAVELLKVIELAAEHADLFAIKWPKGEKVHLHTSDASTWEINAHAKGGWFEIEGEIRLTDEHIVSVGQLLNLLRESNGNYIRLGQNDYLTLSDSLRRQLARIDSIAQGKGNQVRIPELAMAVSGDALQGELAIAEPKELMDLRRRIRESERVAFDIPDTLQATLRDYQEDGFRWMMRLMHWGAGACLADDMGLGKTVQTIACLLAHAHEGAQMVVAPASVVGNWKREIARFAPSLTVVMLNEIAMDNREKSVQQVCERDVLVITYGLLVSESEVLSKVEWVSVCLDEAHTIKNRDTKSSAAAMGLKAKNRIILTGTPIQNHLGELWNLMQFINPGLLGSYEHFNERFITPIAAGVQEPKQQLKRLIAPFLLRRTKQEVARELPDKVEIQVPVTLSDEEMAVYEVIRREAKAELEASSTLSVNALAMITKLREAACSAELVEKKWTGMSSKLEVMTDKLTSMVEEGNRVLVFSQFTSFLKMAKDAMEEAGMKDYFYLDGSTPIKERQRMVDDFQKGKKAVFLISLKAGGLGLNLTGANYVIHLDPWWNPAIEQQATDRAYRIGQQQKVTVYHLISEHTIEEKILRLHESKRNLADSLLEGTNNSHKLTTAELLQLIG